MNWRIITSYTKPLELEKQVTTVYLRRNIEEITDESRNVCWEYEECTLSYEEYAKYLEVKNSIEISIILDKLKEQDETIAEILLNQMEV